MYNKAKTSSGYPMILVLVLIYKLLFEEQHLVSAMANARRRLHSRSILFTTGFIVTKQAYSHKAIKMHCLCLYTKLLSDNDTAV